MSGIDTSRGINFVASRIAALEADHAQGVTTNTGVRVTGLEAAAYEFGSILASYPADAPPLTRNATVFQVTDADGHTSMVSLNDLADDIQRQLGFDPLVEFSAGLGATSEGYSIADINYILGQIENQYSSMSFTQLAQVQGNADLVVSNNVDAQVQVAINQLREALSASQTQISQALAAAPGGVGLDQYIINNPNSPTEQANALARANLPTLSQTISSDRAAVAAAQVALNVANAGYAPADRVQVMTAAANAAAILASGTATEVAAVQNAQNAYDAALVALTAAKALSFGNIPAASMPPEALIDGIGKYLASHPNWGLSNPDGDPWKPAWLLMGGATPYWQDRENVFGEGNGNNIVACEHLFNDYMATLMPNLPSPLITFNPNGSTNNYLFTQQDNAALEEAFCVSQFQALSSAQSALQTAQTQYTNAVNAIRNNPNSSYSAALATYNNAVTTANSNQQAAINAAQSSYNSAIQKLNEDQGRLNSSLSTAVTGSSSPAIAPLQTQVNQITLDINANQAGVISLNSQISNIQNNRSIATTLGANLASAQTALSLNPGDATAQANVAKAKGALESFLGSTYATVADATAARDQYIQTQNTSLNGLQQQLSATTNSLQANQTSLQSLQSRLLQLPTESLNQLLSKIENGTEVDIRAALSAVLGNGPLTAAKLNQVYQYLNQHLPAGVASFQLIGNPPSAESTNAIADSLNNFTVDPKVRQALQDIGTLITEQINAQYLDSNGNLPMNDAVFSMPTVAQSLGMSSTSLVSLGQILTYEEQSRGVSLDQAIPNFADANGNISFSNLRSFLELVNQAVPNLNLPKLSEALLTNPLNATQLAALPSRVITLEEQITSAQNQIATTNANLLSLTRLSAALTQPAQAGAASNLASLIQAIAGDNTGSAAQMAAIGRAANGSASSAANYALSLAGMLGISQPQPHPASEIATILNALSLPVASQAERDAGHVDNLPTLIACIWTGGSPFASHSVVGMRANENPWSINYSSCSLAGLLGIPNPGAAGAGNTYTQSQVTAQYQAVTQRLAQIAPSFTPPAGPEYWSATTFSSLQTALQAEQSAPHYTSAELSTLYQQVTQRLSIIAPTFQAPASPNSWTAATFSSLNTALQAQRPVLQGAVNQQTNSLSQLRGQLSDLLSYMSSDEQISVLQNQVSSLQAQIAAFNASGPAILTSLSGQVRNWDAINSGSAWNLPSEMSLLGGSIAVTGGVVGGGLRSQALYNQTLGGLLGIPRPLPSGPAIAGQPNGVYTESDIAAQYQLIAQTLADIVPNFSAPANPASWTAATLTALQAALQAQQTSVASVNLNITTLTSHIQALETAANVEQLGQTFRMSGQAAASIATWSRSSPNTLGNPADIKTALQNIQFEDVEVAVQAGAASADVAASATQDIDTQTAPVLSAAEMNAQLESGDLYVNSQGQFFLNRQPTNARDAAVAAFVVGGNKLNDKLNDMMNKINLNNTKIQMASYLSAATDVADLQTRIAAQREQYGFADILSEITGGALTDASITSSTDVSGATGTFQSSLKTAINNATNNQDLDTQSLQQLTSQVQANMTAMTQLIQAFEQMLRSLTQNLL